VTRNRILVQRKPRPANRPKPPTKAKRQVAPKKPARRSRRRGRTKR
jgi:hypothetical protein